jgi:ABC-type phosphate transport system substrate-binding protein
MKLTILAAVAAAGAALAAIAGFADAQINRSPIRIVGSSTLYPFSVAVAEQFARAGRVRPRLSRKPGLVAASDRSASVSARNTPTSSMLRAA